MASSEKAFDKEFRDALKSFGAHTFKCSSVFGSGFPDNYSCLNGTSLWTELKFMKEPPALGTTNLQIGLTPLQRKFIREEQEAGGRAGWCLCVKMKIGLWNYYSGGNSRVLSVSQNDFVTSRKGGEQLDVKKIIAAIISDQGT